MTKNDAQPLYDVVLMDFGNNISETNPNQANLHPKFKLFLILTMMIIQIKLYALSHYTLSTHVTHPLNSDACDGWS